MLVTVLLDFWYDKVKQFIVVNLEKLDDRIAIKLKDAVELGREETRYCKVVMTRADMEAVQRAEVSAQLCEGETMVCIVQN